MIWKTITIINLVNLTISTKKKTTHLIQKIISLIKKINLKVLKNLKTQKNLKTKT